MPRRIGFYALALTLISGAVPYASAKPNFTGEWKMDRGKSSFAPLPMPDQLVRRISHREPNLKITTSQSGQQHDIVTELSYTTDGKECTNNIRGQAVTGTAKWQDDQLVIESKREAQGMQLKQRETWTLSEGGHILTIANHVDTPQGGLDITIVLEKQ